ncbi:hypothetical protein J7L13_02995 [bacterium]|nr:hypothetical protein [bacterium]
MKKLILITALVFSTSCITTLTPHTSYLGTKHSLYAMRKIEEANKKGILIKQSGEYALYKVKLFLAPDCYVVFHKDKRATKCFINFDKAMKKFEELSCQD